MVEGSWWGGRFLQLPCACDFKTRVRVHARLASPWAMCVGGRRRCQRRGTRTSTAPHSRALPPRLLPAPCSTWWRRTFGSPTALRCGLEPAPVTLVTPCTCTHAHTRSPLCRSLSTRAQKHTHAHHCAAVCRHAHTRTHTLTIVPQLVDTRRVCWCRRPPCPETHTCTRACVQIVGQHLLRSRAGAPAPPLRRRVGLDSRSEDRAGSVGDLTHVAAEGHGDLMRCVRVSAAHVDIGAAHPPSNRTCAPAHPYTRRQPRGCVPLTAPACMTCPRLRRFVFLGVSAPRKAGAPPLTEPAVCAHGAVCVRASIGQCTVC